MHRASPSSARSWCAQPAEGDFTPLLYCRFVTALDFCIVRIDEAGTVPNMREAKRGDRDASRAARLGNRANRPPPLVLGWRARGACGRVQVSNVRGPVVGGR